LKLLACAGIKVALLALVMVGGNLTSSVTVAFGEQRVSLRAPSGPYSFSGRLISLLWALEAVAEPGGEVARREIVLSPSGEEVRLDAQGAARDPV
jgi:hypothetical protein